MADNVVPDYQTKLEISLLVAKVGAIVLLFIMAFFYYRNSKDSKFTNTFFKNDESRIKGIGAAAITGLIASLTTLYIMGSRGFFSVIALLIIFSVLFFYDIGLEASGLNRWLNMSELATGHGPYADLNNLTPDNADDLKELGQSVTNVDPFYNASLFSFMALTGMVAAYLSWEMLSATRAGYKSGKNYISDAVFWGGKMSPGMGFFIESLFMALNGLIPLINAKIRGEELNNTIYMNMFLFSSGSIVLHTMVQYCGLYKINH